MTVAQLIEELKSYPMDAQAYAYEGEVIGVVICKWVIMEGGCGLRDQLGYIECWEGDHA